MARSDAQGTARTAGEEGRIDSMRPDNSQTLKHVLCYVRVSTKNSAQETSLENQESQLREFCKRKGWLVDEVIVDHGISGRKMERPGLKRMIELIRAGGIDIVLAADHARYARDPKFIDFYLNHLSPNGIEVWTLDSKQDLATAEGELVNGVIWLALQYMARKTSDRIRASIPVRRERGLWLGRTPFGTVPGAVKGVPEKDPETWHYLIQIFQRHREGQSQCAIADWLNELGVPSRLGGLWRQGTIWSILRSPFYRGVDNVGTLLRHDCLVPREYWPDLQQAESKCGRPSERFFLLRNLVCSPYWQVSSRRRYHNDPMPMQCRGCFETPVYQRVDVTKNGQHFEVTDGEPCEGIPIGTVRAQWLEDLVLNRLIEHADVAGSKALLPRVRKAQQTSIARLEELIAEQELYLDKVRARSVKAGRHLLQAYDKEMGQSLIDSLDAEHKAAKLEYERTADRIALLQQELEHARKAKPEKCEILQINLIQELVRNGHMTEVRKLLLATVDRIELRLYRDPEASHKQKHGTVSILLKAPFWATNLEGQLPDNIESLLPDAAPQCAPRRRGRQ